MENLIRRIIGAGRRFLSSILNRFQTPRERLKHRLKLQIESERVAVGRFTYGLPMIYEWDEPSQVRIGAFCSIADGVVIFAGGERRMDFTTTYPFNSTDYFKSVPVDGLSDVKTKGDVVIGSDVWIGHDSTIMSGVNIGHGAVIGARAVVTKNVAPYEIVAGVPAKVIGFRFDEPMRQRLLELEWWDLDVELIEELIPVLMREPTESTLDKISQARKKKT
jgi:acetyltransferase-like isoleucine patch superfamily enzyme